MYGSGKYLRPVVKYYGKPGLAAHDICTAMYGAIIVFISHIIDIGTVIRHFPSGIKKGPACKPILLGLYAVIDDTTHNHRG